MIKKLQILLKKDWFILLLIISVSFVLRIWFLGQIKEEIFDEFYFIDFAKKYLSGTSFYDIHPPFGKLIIALAIKILGDHQWVWRICEALFGTAFIYVVYLTGREISGRVVGLISAGLIALDGMFLAYSRVGLMDIFLSFFMILSFYLFLRFKNSKKLFYLVLAGINLALAASVKYVGFLLYGAFFWVILVENISIWKNKWKFLIFLIIVPILIYCVIFLANFPLKSLFQDVWAWQKQSFDSNFYSKGLTHPYGSKWWTWLWLYKPVCFYFKTLTDGRFMVMYGLGNPFIWWTALLAFPVWLTMVFKKNHAAFLILVPFLVLYIPWSFTTRILYIYHAMPAFVFLIFGLAIVLESFLKYRPGRWIVAIYFTIAAMVFIYFLPFWLAIPISPNAFYHRIWLKSWI